jgi:hypothetical protein
MNIQESEDSNQLNIQDSVVMGDVNIDFQKMNMLMQQL